MAAAQAATVERSPYASQSAWLARNAAWIALAVLTVIAAALRFPFLGHPSLWFDEIYTREIVREPTLAGLWRHVEATESTPPLFYLVVWLIKARSTVALRLLPALALTASVPVSYFAFQRLIGRRAALATAAILAVNPMLVWYSTDARSYGLFVLTGLLSVWGFSALLEEGSKRRFALWAFASVACMWTHYFGIFLVGGEVVVLLFARPTLRNATVLWTVLVGLCLIPLVPLVSSQTSNERAGYIAAIPLSKRFTETVRQFAMGSNVPRTWLEAAGLAIFCLALAVGIWFAARSRRPPRLLLIAAAIAFAVPLLLSLTKIENRFYSRNMIATLPLAAALAAPALLRLRAVPLALYLVLATLTSVWVATNWRYEQADWRLALARVEQIEPAAPVLVVTELDASVAKVYLGRAPASAPLRTRRLWVVVEPVRATGDRFLGPSPIPSIPGFVTQGTLRLQGFQLVLLKASKPTAVSSGEVPDTTLFAGRR